MPAQDRAASRLFPALRLLPQVAFEGRHYHRAEVATILYGFHLGRPPQILGKFKRRADHRGFAFFRCPSWSRCHSIYTLIRWYMVVKGNRTAPRSGNGRRAIRAVITLRPAHFAVLRFVVRGVRLRVCEVSRGGRGGAAALTVTPHGWQSPARLSGMVRGAAHPSQRSICVKASFTLSLQGKVNGETAKGAAKRAVFYLVSTA